ncbi:MAG: FtsX-like permease family protein [Kiritimatiellia bacterium]
MIRSATLSLALKYFKPRRSITSMVNVLCVAGILLGVAVLVVVTSVMNGFGEMWKEKLLSFNPHIVVAARGGLRETGGESARILAVPGVTSCSPFIESLVVIEHRKQMQPAAIRGIDLARDALAAKLTNSVESGTFSLADEEAMMGSDLAFTLGVSPGREISVMTPRALTGDKEIRLPDELEVRGLFRVGMYQIDEGFIVTSLDTARDLLGMEEGEVDGLQVMVNDPGAAAAVARVLRRDLGPGYSVRTWMEMNQVLFGALATEKNLMFFLMAIISVVACFMVMSTLITVTVQKTREIGLMKALGFSGLRVALVFLWYALIQGLLGVGLGVVTGVLVIRYRNAVLDGMSWLCGRELLPKELYFLDELPARLLASDVAMISAVVLAMTLLAALIPALVAGRKDPLEALRDD